MDTNLTGADGRRAKDGVALLIVDLVNAMAFEGGDALRERTEAIVEPLLRLREQADERGVPVIYVNDNRGQWRSDHAAIVDACLHDDSPARDIVERLRPRPDDYFVIKPHLSGFYATNLPVLLPKLGASRLVLTGVATDLCVLFTAADAHMRDYDLWVPRDAVASETAEGGDWALDIMARTMAADTTPVRERSIAGWTDRCERRSSRDVAERS